MQDPQHTQIFIEAVESVFAAMFSMPVTYSEPCVKHADEPWLDITGAIGLTGSLSGAMALTFHRTTAEGVASELLGAATGFDSEDTADAIGELANIIAGKAKASLNTDGSMSISCPSVTRGACVTYLNPGAEVVAIDIDCALGQLRLEYSLKTTVADADNHHAAA